MMHGQTKIKYNLFSLLDVFLTVHHELTIY